MRFDIKAFLRLMKQSWQGGGVKILRTEHRGLWDSFFITGAGWALLIPKEHIESAADITEENSAIVAHIFAVAAKLAKELDLVQGWRVVTNVGKDGGQTVMHMHFHLLGGRSMAWPPG